MAKTKQDSIFGLPIISEADQKLLAAYKKTDIWVYDLPYTSAFNALISLIGGDKSQKGRYHIFQRLLILKKRSLLPRVAGQPY